MSRKYDFDAPRVFLEADLAEGTANIELDRARTNYLRTVLRLRDGDRVLAFNGRDGEWVCVLESPTRKTTALRVDAKTREQTTAGDIDYLFAPLKQARQDYLAQKAVEMGASRLRPIVTRRTQTREPNLDRLRANAIEAAEQCGVLSVPSIEPAVSFESLLRDWPQERLLIFCDEDAPTGDPIAALRALDRRGPLAIFVGPEGGFDPSEREALKRASFTVTISLGPRILRADTAAVAALAVVQCALGDWR